jgi:hypothetical protein
VFLFISCSAGSKSKLIGSQFSFHNQSRELSIHFISRDSLVIKNIFDCDIDSVYQSLDFKVGYSLKRKEIYLTDYEEYQLPYFENTSCFFLTEDYRKRQKRNYPGGPLVRDNDATLFLFPKIKRLVFANDSTLIFYDTVNDLESVGFTFQKK